MKATYQTTAHQVLVTFQGDYLAYDSLQEKEALFDLIHKKGVQKIHFDSTQLNKWDSSLLLILFQIEKEARARKIQVDLTGLPSGLVELLKLALSVDRKPPQTKQNESDFLTRLGGRWLGYAVSFEKGLAFIGDCLRSFGRGFSGKAIMRKVDFLFALEECGPRAIGIVSLISFMVGLILAFVGALQLKNFGAQVYVASLVTVGMTRIMGAIMAAIIMAGRTGASYAAGIGTMQVNEELDALKTMGISTTDFLVLPRMIALVIAMPLLTILADFMGMIGGGFVGVLMLDIPIQEYWKFSLSAFSLNNFLVGVFHGLVFGFVIALCGCYYGVNCGRNADSVGKATTLAVVSAIVWMIVMTGFITVFFERLGV